MDIRYKGTKVTRRRLPTSVNLVPDDSSERDLTMLGMPTLPAVAPPERELTVLGLPTLSSLDGPDRDLTVVGLPTLS